MVPLGLLVLNVGVAGAEPCAVEVATLELVQAVDRVEEAYRGLLHTEAEEEAFRALQRAEARLRGAIPCSATAITPALASRVHAVLGLAAFADQRLDAAEHAFAAARRSDPGLPAFPWLQPTDPEALAWQALDPSLAWRVEQARPRRGLLWWDGVASTARPGPWPVIVQHLDPSVRFTAYLEGEEGLPVYARRPPRSAWALVGSGAGLASVGIGLLAAGGALFAQHCAPQVGQACGSMGALPPRAVADRVEDLVDAGAVLTAVGALGAVAGGVWVAVAAKPRAVSVRVGGPF